MLDSASDTRPGNRTSVWIAAVVVIVIALVAAYFIYAQHVISIHDAMQERNPY